MQLESHSNENGSHANVPVYLQKFLFIKYLYRFSRKKRFSIANNTFFVEKFAVCMKTDPFSRKQCAFAYKYHYPHKEITILHENEIIFMQNDSF